MNSIYRLMNLGSALALMLMVLASSALAKNIVYQYQDSTGATAFTKDLGEVPANQRAKAKSGAIDIDALPPVNVLTAPPESKTAPSAPTKTDTAAIDTKSKAYWKGRYDKAKSDRDAARMHLQIVQYNLRDNNSLGGPGMQQRQADYAKRETELKHAIARYDAQINGGIAEEARRAGAPVEWYRDLTGDSSGN